MSHPIIRCQDEDRGSLKLTPNPSVIRKRPWESPGRGEAEVGGGTLSFPTSQRNTWHPNLMAGERSWHLLPLAPNTRSHPSSEQTLPRTILSGPLRHPSLGFRRPWIAVTFIFSHSEDAAGNQKGQEETTRPQLPPNSSSVPEDQVEPFWQGRPWGWGLQVPPHTALPRTLS